MTGQPEGAKNVPPGLPVSLRCPQDGKILAHFAGEYDATYVALSPFIRPRLIPAERFRPDTYPDHRTIVADCVPVCWAEVQRLAGFESLEEIDIALRTSLLGLRRDLCRDDLAERLASCLAREGLIPPAEGHHPGLMSARVMRMFAELGHDTAVVEDEFGESARMHPISDLLAGSVQLPAHCNIHTPDRSLLWTVHWDSHCTLLCASNDILERLKVDTRLEGFHCSPKTEVYWSVHPR